MKIQVPTYKDAILWDLLQLEINVDQKILSRYWKFVDAIMETSSPQKITILANKTKALIHNKTK